MGEGWAVPLISALGVALWLAVVWVARREPWAPLLLVILSAAVAFLLTSLRYPGVVDVDTSRFAGSTERIILLLSGAWALVITLRMVKRR